MHYPNDSAAAGRKPDTEPRNIAPQPVPTAQIRDANTWVHAVVPNAWTHEEITACGVRMGHAWSTIEERPEHDIDCPQCITEIEAGRQHAAYAEPDETPHEPPPPRREPRPAPERARPRPPQAPEKTNGQGSLF